MSGDAPDRSLLYQDRDEARIKGGKKSAPSFTYQRNRANDFQETLPGFEINLHHYSQLSRNTPVAFKTPFGGSLKHLVGRALWRRGMRGKDLQHNA